MIGRKLVLIKNGQVFIQEQKEINFEVPYLKEVGHLTVKNIKKYEHLALVAILRFYVRATNLLKYQYGELKNKIKTRNKKSQLKGEKQEASKFLKMISDYKHRIKEIKHRIKEEEKDL